MFKNRLSIFLFLIILSPVTIASSVNYKLDGVFRTKPRATNAVAEAAYDHLIWGELDKKKPLYGYGRVGAKLGGSPGLAAFLQFAPIAPVIFEVQQSRTKRFLKSSEFNCAQVECLNTVKRLDYSIRLLGGYKDFFATALFLWRKIETPASSMPVMVELEYFTLSPKASHQFYSNSFIVGHNLSEDLSFGLAYEHADISKQNKEFENMVGFTRLKWKDIQWSVGAGRFRSNETNITGNGVFLSLSKKFGESLSLL